MEVGIYKCRFCKKRFESKKTENFTKCPFCGQSGEIKRIELKKFPYEKVSRRKNV